MSGRVRRWRSAVAAGLGAGVLAWLFGVHPADAVLIAVVAGAAVGLPVLLGAPEGVEVEVPEDGGGTGSWEPVRRLEMLLRQAADEPDAFGHRLRPRLREVAERWLHRHGHRWDDEASPELLGHELHRLLSARPDTDRDASGRQPDPVTVTEMLVARLRDDDGATPTQGTS